MESEKKERAVSSHSSGSKDHKKSEKQRKSNRSRSRSRSRDRRNSDSKSRHSRGRDRSRKRKIEVLVPATNGPLATFREFVDMQKSEIAPELAEKVYSKYKKKYEQRHIELFFYEHKEDEWFKEKYHPELVEEINENYKKRVVKEAEYFFESVKEGEYDNLSLEINDTVLEATEGRAFYEQLKEKNMLYSQDLTLKEDSLDITAAPYFGFDSN